MRSHFQRTTPNEPLAANVRSLIRGERGETITETLVAVLIGGLALLMLAVVMATSNHIISDSKNAMNDYYGNTNQIALASGSGTKSGTVTLSVVGDTTGSSITKDVTYSIDKVAGKTVVAYWASTGAATPETPETPDNGGGE